MLDPETTLDTVGKASEAATKFQEIILKVMGPRWTKKQADADAYADERKLQVIRDNPDMEIVYTQNGMLARARSPEALTYRAEQRMLNDAIRQEANLESVLELAAAEIGHIADANNDPVDDDWITRFFSIVKDINTTEMQCLWGKILAGEVVRPGSFSMRTLETIRNLSQTEATLFQKLCNCAVQFDDNVIVPSDLQLLNSKGISYTDLVAVSEAGLINLKELRTATEFPPNVTMHMQLYNKTHLIHITGKTENTTLIDCGIYKFTKVGAEIYRALETVSDEQYIVDLAKIIAAHNKRKASIFVHRIISHTDGNIRYEVPPIYLQERLK